MILYVNGDSHSAGAEAVNTFAFANDDPMYWGMGRKPHPDNERASYGCLVANHLYAILHCDAESASSNDRIIRTTDEYLKQFTPEMVIIGWATWEREEWLHDGTYYQLTASGTDTVPPELKNKYKEWVIAQSDHNVINQKFVDMHKKIFDLHIKLNDLDIPHLFFNTYSDFGHIKNLKHLGSEEVDWNGCYLEPYNPNFTYYNWLKSKGFSTVNPNSYHFGAKAHEAWADYILPTVLTLVK